MTQIRTIATPDDIRRRVCTTEFDKWIERLQPEIEDAVKNNRTKCVYYTEDPIPYYIQSEFMKQGYTIETDRYSPLNDKLKLSISWTYRTME